MATLKTQKNDASVDQFIASIEDSHQREDCRRLLELMSGVLKTSPQMWGDSIVGFGQYQYRYASGREGTWFVAGFSPRQRALSLYLMGGAAAPEMLATLGDYTMGKSCIYAKRLDNLHLPTLRKMLRAAAKRCKAITAAAAQSAQDKDAKVAKKTLRKKK